MLAAVPAAHQPCGANGLQLSPAREGSATAIATTITPRSTDESPSWNAEVHAEPERVREQHDREHREADGSGHGRTGAGEIGNVVAADQRHRRGAEQHGGKEPGAGYSGGSRPEPLADIGRDATRDRMAHPEGGEGDRQGRREHEQSRPRQDRCRPGRRGGERGDEQHAGADQRTDIQRGAAPDTQRSAASHRRSVVTVPACAAPCLDSARDEAARDRRRRHVHRCGARRGRPRDGGQGADGPAAGGVGTGGRGRAGVGLGAASVDRFTHGTTVATNALLERRGARTAFVTTEGFEHLLHLRRQDRAHLYRLCEQHPEPLVPLERCYGVSERIGPDGCRLPARARVAAGDRRGGDRRLPALQLPRPEPRARGRRGASAALSGVARRRLARARARVPRVRARLDDGRRRLPRPVDGAGTCARSATACARGGAARAARDALLGRRHLDRGGRRPSGADPRLRARRRGDRRGADRQGGRSRERDLARHGRYLDRRLPDRGRRGRPLARALGRRLPGAAADGRHPHDRRRRRVDRLARRRRRAAGRARAAPAPIQGPPATAAAGPSRRSPTRT